MIGKKVCVASHNFNPAANCHNFLDSSLPLNVTHFRDMHALIHTQAYM